MTGAGARSAPLPLLVPALVAVAFLVIPLAGLILRAPWGNFWEILHGSQAGEALKLSLWTSSVATAISLVVGVPLAWVLARTDFPGLRLVRALGEFGATITFAGSFPGRTQTMPIAVYYALETDPDAAILLSLVLLLVSVVVLVTLRDKWLRGGSAP